MEAAELGAQFIIRAHTNGRLVPEESEGCASILEALGVALGGDDRDFPEETG